MLGLFNGVQHGLCVYRILAAWLASCSEPSQACMPHSGYLCWGSGCPHPSTSFGTLWSSCFCAQCWPTSIDPAASARRTRASASLSSKLGQAQSATLKAPTLRQLAATPKQRTKQQFPCLMTHALRRMQPRQKRSATQQLHCPMNMHLRKMTTRSSSPLSPFEESLRPHLPTSWHSKHARTEMTSTSLRSNRDMHAAVGERASICRQLVL